MEMAGRGFSGSYRFGYQGSEKDNEVSGEGNSYTTEFRQLDPRLGRWFSVDPLYYKFPYITPYSSMHNNPINYTDKSGLGPNSIPVTYDGQTYQFEKVSEEEKSNLPKQDWIYSDKVKIGNGTAGSSFFDKTGKLLYVEIAGVKYKIKGSIVPPSKIKENVETTSAKTEKLEEAKPAQDKKDETISETKKTEDTKKTDKVKTAGEIKKKKVKKDEKPKGELKDPKKDGKKDPEPTTKIIPVTTSIDNLNIAFDSNEDEFDSPTDDSYGSDLLDEDLKGVIATLRKNKSNFVTIQVTTANTSYTTVSSFGDTRALLEARKRAVMNEFQRLAPDLVKNGQVKVFYDNSSLSNGIGFTGKVTEYIEVKK